jgi:hypothetical protein
VRFVVVVKIGSLALGALGALGTLAFVIVIGFPWEVGNVGVEMEVGRRVNSAWWEWVLRSFWVVRPLMESRDSWVRRVAGDTALRALAALTALGTLATLAT